MSIKRLWCFGCMIFLAIPTAGFSQVLLYDGFSNADYSVGPAQGVGYGGIGIGYEQNGTWNSGEFIDGGLTHPTLVTTPGVRVLRNSGDMEANLDVSPGGIFDAVALVGTNGAIGGEGITGRSLYYSFLGREVDGDGGGWGGFNLWNPTGGDEHVGVGNGGGPNDYVSYHHDSGEPPITAPPVPIDGDVHFFVVRGDYVDGKDTYTFWLDPDPTLSEAAQAAGSFSSAGTRDEDGNGFTQFRMRGDQVWEFDEIRFGLTWEDVTPVPEPATGLLALLGIGAMVHLRRRT